MDRRVKKTNQAIINAFMSLLKEKPVNKISVLELSEKADINRKTFYLHFKDIYDLEEKLRVKLFNEHSNEIIENISFSNFSTQSDVFINYLFERLSIVSSRFKDILHTDFFKSLLKDSINNMRDPFIEAYLKNGGKNINKATHYYSFITAGIVELFYIYAQTNSIQGKNEIKEVLIDLVKYDL